MIRDYQTGEVVDGPLPTGDPPLELHTELMWVALPENHLQHTLAAMGASLPEPAQGVNGGTHLSDEPKCCSHCLCSMLLSASIHLATAPRMNGSHQLNLTSKSSIGKCRLSSREKVHTVRGEAIPGRVSDEYHQHRELLTGKMSLRLTVKQLSKSPLLVVCPVVNCINN